MHYSTPILSKNASYTVVSYQMRSVDCDNWSSYRLAGY
jgi:hypothetical protein